jgi:flagellar assembly protein FliH
MGLIKRSKIEDKGTLFLEPIKPQPRTYTEDLPEETAYGEPTESLQEDHSESDSQHADLPQEMIPAGTDADTYANDTVRAARMDADRIRRESRELGYSEGVKKANLESTARTQEALETLNQALAARKTIISEAESDILRLAIKVAEQVIRNEITLHRDVAMNIISEAIARVSDREQIILKVNKEDIENVKRYKDRLASVIDGVKSFSILEDTQVEPGGCIIETNLGFIDARIKTRIDQIEHALWKAKDSGNR